MASKDGAAPAVRRRRGKRPVLWRLFLWRAPPFLLNLFEDRAAPWTRFPLPPPFTNSRRFVLRPEVGQCEPKLCPPRSAEVVNDIVRESACPPQPAWDNGEFSPCGDRPSSFPSSRHRPPARATIRRAAPPRSRPRRRPLPPPPVRRATAPRRRHRGLHQSRHRQRRHHRGFRRRSRKAQSVQSRRPTLAFAPTLPPPPLIATPFRPLGYDAAAASQGTPSSPSATTIHAGSLCLSPFPSSAPTYRQVFVNSDGNLTFTAGDAPAAAAPSGA